MRKAKISFFVLMMILLGASFGNAKARQVCRGKVFDSHPKLLLECLHVAALRQVESDGKSAEQSRTMPVCTESFAPGSASPTYDCADTPVEDMPADVLCIPAGDGYFCAGTYYDQGGSPTYDSSFLNEYQRYIEANDLGEGAPLSEICIPELCPDITPAAKPTIVPVAQDLPTPTALTYPVPEVTESAYP